MMPAHGAMFVGNMGEQVDDIFCVKVAMEEELCIKSSWVWCCGAESGLCRNSDGTLGNDEET